MGHIINFQRPDGKELQGYLAEPAGKHQAPAIVVIQEWWGLNDHIQTVENHLPLQKFV